MQVIPYQTLVDEKTKAVKARDAAVVESEELQETLDQQILSY